MVLIRLNKGIGCYDYRKGDNFLAQLERMKIFRIEVQNEIILIEAECIFRTSRW